MKKAMIKHLSAGFPGRKFMIEHIDPVTLGENKKNGLMKKQTNTYAFIDLGQ